jgi:hypothetical protein
MLDVNGAISVGEATALVSNNAATVPTDYSLVRLTGSATAPVTLTPAATPAPVTGQQLTIYNSTAYAAAFNGWAVRAGLAVAFVYANGSWQAIAGIGDNLGNHTATQALNLQSYGLVGSGDDLGTTLGVGVTTSGGLNLGQNTQGNNITLGYQAGQSSTTGNSNLLMGYQSGQASTSANNNQFVGYRSGYRTTTGSNNNFAGYTSGFSNTTGGTNHFDGFASGFSNTTGSQNTFIGYRSGQNNLVGTANMFVGFLSGQANTLGNFNQFEGYSSGFANTTGNQNMFNGYQSGQSNTTGSQNTFVGYQSGQSSTTANQNTFVGYRSGYMTTTGSSNHFEGYASGFSNTTGSQNTFVGYQTGQVNTEGSNNQFDGYHSGFNTTTGSGNVFVGSNSGLNNITGTGNTALGYQAGPTADSFSNATAIGYGASVSASNKIRLGNTDVTVIEGQVAYTYPSDARFKYNVRQNVPGLAFIKKLRPVTYQFDRQKLARFTATAVLDSGCTASAHDPTQTGFLAQQVAQAAREVGFAFDGVHFPANKQDHYSLAYSQFIMPLVQAVQEQQVQIDALRTANDHLSADNACLKASGQALVTAQALAELQTTVQALQAELQAMQLHRENTLTSTLLPEASKQSGTNRLASH